MLESLFMKHMTKNRSAYLTLWWCLVNNKTVLGWLRGEHSQVFVTILKDLKMNSGDARCIIKWLRASGVHPLSIIDFNVLPKKNRFVALIAIEVFFTFKLSSDIFSAIWIIAFPLRSIQLNSVSLSLFRFRVLGKLRDNDWVKSLI